MPYYYLGVMPMKKDKLFYVPFMVKDWIVDTQQLTLLERGAYITIISNMYLKEDGIIEENSLPNLLGLKGNNYNRVMTSLKPYLVKTDKGYTQNKVQDVIREINHKRKVNSQNGKLGMKKRWSTKHNKTLDNKQTNNNEPYNHAITNSLQTNKQTIDNKQYTYIDKYSSLTEEQRKEKERLKFNADMINNNI